MTAQQLINILKVAGVELVADQGSLKAIATRTKITDEQKAMISENKAALLAYLATTSDARNCGSLASNEPEPTVDTSNITSTPTAHPFHKEYKLPNGETLRLTKAEFDHVVDLFRQLHQQYARLRQDKGVAS